MDGISVAASILGLVGAAAKVTLYLNALVTSVKTAPKLAQSVLLEVSDVSICLSQLQRLLLGMERGCRSRERLNMIEELVVVLSNCVSIFSELEEILESLDLMSSTTISKIKIASWLRRQNSISTLLMRLQRSKQSLTLIVTTLNCTSGAEAEDALSELKALITQVLESNQVLAERMANLELQHSAHALSKAPSSTEDGEDYHGKSGTTLRQEERILDDGETSTYSSTSALGDKGKDQDNESIVTIRRIGPVASETLTAADGFAFEEDLFASRPYVRAINRRPCQSATSSVVPTMGWSYLSGLNFTNVSKVSILSLPLSPLELWNGHRYITARDDLEDSAGVTAQQRQASVTPTKSITTIENPAVSSRLFGKLFDGWDSFHKMRKIDWPVISSRDVVILGVPFSGKRTIYQQLRLFDGHVFNQFDSMKPVGLIFHYLIETFIVAWKCVEFLDKGDLAPTDVQVAYSTIVSFENKIHKIDFYNPSLYSALQTLWRHDSLRRAIQNGKGLALYEAIDWCFEHLELLFGQLRLLSDDFVLRQGYSLSYHCQSIEIDGRGSQYLPKPWLDDFNSTDALIFVVPLSSYCQNEPTSTTPLNMMKQQIRFFEYLTRLRKFDDVPIIILLNKTDMLEQLITTRPISDYFTGYTAGANCFQACQFFADKFVKSDHRAVGDLRIYGTCAVQESGFRETLEELQNRPNGYNETVPSNRLEGEGLARIYNPVTKRSVEKMLRKCYEESFPKTLY
ncbi:hypothetical protein JMJ35_006134 [Cladonia borealis]|uniref:Uncharacterized protein n=1 Tax=Cladonia borealis TaxID=184061 RepID=A0AA39R022_9LECA|nr:hypothetical protein JMJ35_006134 [Cladonia borealis]